MLLFQRICSGVICNRCSEAPRQPQRRGVSDLVVIERRSTTYQAQIPNDCRKIWLPSHLTRKRIFQTPADAWESRGRPREKLPRIEVAIMPLQSQAVSGALFLVNWVQTSSLPGILVVALSWTVQATLLPLALQEPLLTSGRFGFGGATGFGAGAGAGGAAAVGAAAGGSTFGASLEPAAVGAGDAGAAAWQVPPSHSSPALQ
jgi:hypothetical protein